MKKFLLLLLGLVAASSVVSAQTYKWTAATGNFSKKQLSFKNTADASDVLSTSWTLTTTGSGTLQNVDPTKGQQLGSSAKHITGLTMSTSAFADKTISSITINASTGSGGTAVITSVTVGGNAFDGTGKLTTTPADYAYTGSASGDIEIKFTNTAKAFYVKSIEITCTEGRGETPVSIAKPAIEVSSDFVVTLTSATEGAAIRYTLDGSTPSATEGNIYSAPFALTANCTISAVAYDAEGNTSAVTTKAVTNMPVALTSAAEIYTLPQATTFTLTEDLVVISSVANYTILAGQNRNILLYNQAATLPVGLQVTKVYGTTASRNNLVCVTGWSVEDTQTNVELPTPTEITIADVKGTADTDMLNYVKFTNVSISGTGYNFTMTQGSESVQLYNQYGVEVYTGEGYDVVGVIGIYNSNVQINPILVEKHAEVGVLGDITLDGQLIGNTSEITVDINTKLTFAATNAEMISCVWGDFHDTVEGSTIEFTPTTAGSNICQIEAIMGNNTKQVSFRLNVVKPRVDLASFAWSPATYTYKQGTDFTAPTLTASVDPATLLIDYTSSDPAIAAVDADGVITLGGELGRATITAEFIGDDDYNPATALCTIVVKGDSKTHYVLVDDVADVTTGTNYILTMFDTTNIGVNFVMGAQGLERREAVDAVFEDNAIFELPEGASTFQFENSDNASYPYHILLEDGYLYAPNVKKVDVTADKTTADAYKVAIKNGDATITCSKSAYVLSGTYSGGVKAAATNAMFRHYAAAQKPVQLYREVVTPTAATATCSLTPNEEGQYEHITGSEGTKLTLVAAADHELYYSDGTATAPASAPALDHTGYTKADNGSVELTIHNSGVVNYYTVKDGVKGKKQSVVFIGATGINAVNAPAGSSAAIYDLQGRRVINPTRGLYIQGGRVVRY